tara:strand:- start:1537 stop:2685 length:1149 start_codon:yes stop_codon:yes gene_type:complete
MPKSVREIKNFNVGIVTAADDNDIKIDAATYSQDIDPNSTEGRLRGRWKDVLIDLPKWRTHFHFAQPSVGGDGQIPREINVLTTGIVDNTLYQNDTYRVDVNLVGTIPTSNVVIKIEIDDFANMDDYLKINDTNDTSGYPNSGEYIELTFTSGNWQTLQTFYLIPQNVTTEADIGLKLKYTAQSTDAKWNSTDVDFNHNYSYRSDVVSGVIVKRSTFKNSGVLEGEQQGFKVEVKLSSNPNFIDSTSTVDLTFTSDDSTKLKADYPSGGASVASKTLSFTNANYNTYQIIYPYAIDDGVKNGNWTEQLHISGNSNGNTSYINLDTDIASLVRYDDGNFVTNDFMFAGSSSWNFVVTETGGTGSGDDGSGDGENSDDNGWKGP